MELAGDADQVFGTPELAPIGKRIEMLRIERGISKQQLAKAAGVSRQQLWRVLAGKSELTSSLRDRLAFVLRTDAASLHGEAPEPGRADASTASGWTRTMGTTTGVAGTFVTPSAPVATFAEFAADPAQVQSLLAHLPACEAGLALKRAVLDAIEDVAMARGVALPAAFFDLRRGVITRTL